MCCKLTQGVFQTTECDAQDIIWGGGQPEVRPVWVQEEGSGIIQWVVGSYIVHHLFFPLLLKLILLLIIIIIFYFIFNY